MSGLDVEHVIRTAIDIECSVCQATIGTGTRAAFVPGRGYVHLRCLLVPVPDDPPEPADPDHGEQE